jgi:predicted heme/steroid binding protein/uncharacterized membrane protein
MKEFDTEELAKYNGEMDPSVYIAHGGDVIDVSKSKLWKGGLHMKRHHAGGDLTTDIQAAPHGLEVLERYPKVGRLKKNRNSDRELPVMLTGLLVRFPMLRRHPHPMTVHFPIVFMTSTTVFNLLYLITGIKAFEMTAVHCLAGGILFTCVAILTGLYTWWLNYLSKPLKAVSIKKRVSVLMLLISITAFIWRVRVPNILSPLHGISYLYLLLVLSFFPLVTIIGWFGAQLTFPIERD